MIEDESSNGAAERLRRGFAALGEQSAPGPECPEPERLWDAAAGEGTAEERREVIAHTASCASCAAVFRLARGLTSEGSATSRGADDSTRNPPLRGPWRRWGVPLAAIAAVLTFALLVPSPLSHTVSTWVHPASPYRGDESLEILSRLPDDADVPREAADLIWSEGPTGSRYEVRVSSRSGEEIAVVPGLETPRYRIPESSLTRLPAGAHLYWQVKLVSADGTSAMSKTFSLRLR